MIAALANEASDVNDALQTCLDLVCNFTKWPIGHLYMLDQEAGDLYPTNIWHLNPPDQFEAFRKVTEDIRFASGVGLPGRVLATGDPAWIVDVSKDNNFPRSKLETEIGIKAGFAFPISVGSNVIAVLEFFSREAVEPISSLFEIMDHIGAQLGRTIERARSKHALLSQEEKLRSIIQSSNVTAIVSIDNAGNLTTWNPGAQKAFGYSEKEILGQPLTCLIPERYRNAHQAGLKRAYKSENYNIIGKTVELSGLHKEGNEFPLELALGVWEDDGRKYFSAIINDITERKHAESQIHKLAYTDQQTGLSNEAFFLERLSEILNKNGKGFVASIELSEVGDVI
jgi:PAS domain S-box-containing protein